MWCRLVCLSGSMLVFNSNSCLCIVMMFYMFNCTFCPKNDLSTIWCVIYRRLMIHLKSLIADPKRIHTNSTHRWRDAQVLVRVLVLCDTFSVGFSSDGYFRLLMVSCFLSDQSDVVERKNVEHTMKMRDRRDDTTIHFEVANQVWCRIFLDASRCYVGQWEGKLCCPLLLGLLPSSSFSSHFFFSLYSSSLISLFFSFSSGLNLFKIVGSRSSNFSFLLFFFRSQLVQDCWFQIL